jgi:hypothetical protein
MLACTSTVILGPGPMGLMLIFFFLKIYLIFITAMRSIEHHSPKFLLDFDSLDTYVYICVSEGCPIKINIEI